MNGLEVLNPQTPQVLLRGENRGVAEDAPEEFKVAPVPQVVDGERVTQSVGTGSDASDTRRRTDRFEVAKEVPLGHPCTSLSAKNIAKRVSPEIDEQPLPALRGHRHEPVLISLTHHTDGHLVEVNVFFPNVQALRNSESGIKQNCRNRPCTRHVHTSRPVRH